MDSTQDGARAPDLVDSWGTHPDKGKIPKSTGTAVQERRTVGHLPAADPLPGPDTSSLDIRDNGRIPAKEGTPSSGGEPPLESSAGSQEDAPDVSYGQPGASPEPSSEDDEEDEEEEGEEYEVIPE